MKTFLPALMGVGLLLSAEAGAQAEREIQLAIESQALTDALNELAQAAGLRLIGPASATRNLPAPRLRGTFTAQAALDRLLDGTSLTYEFIDPQTVAIHERTQVTGANWQTSGNEAHEPELHLTKLSGSDVSRNGPSGAGTAVAAGYAADDSPRSVDGRPQREELEEVVVTGSHMRGVTPVGSPLLVIDRQAIRESGYSRVQDYLDVLSQNFSGSASERGIRFDDRDRGTANDVGGQAIDLRGLGASSTLVLVNGRRQAAGGLQGSFVDISSIATAALERIEILTDGASAVYGADAIGGVVNFVLRNDYEGLETDVHIASTDGVAEEVRASQLFGTTWEGGNLLLGYQFSRHDALPASEAFFSSRNGDLRRFGGNDFRTPNGSPGTILHPTTRAPAYAIPAGQDGTNLQVSDLVPGQNYYDGVTNSDALPEQTQHSAFFTATQSIGDNFEVFLEGRLGEREMDARFGGYVGTLVVPSSNPFLVDPFGAGLARVAYDYSNDLGPTIYTSNTSTRAVTLGGRVKLGSEWAVRSDATYATENNEWKWLNLVHEPRVSEVLASSDPSIAFNPFGDGGGTSSATLDYVRNTLYAEGDYTLKSLTAIVDGPVFELPAGEVRLAFGADYRDEVLEAGNGRFAPSTGIVTPNARSIGDLDRQVTAVFAEVGIPVLERHLYVPGLDIVVAGRYEDYSDFGSTTNPKIGIDLTPLPGLKLRGSWGTSFRAPRFNEISATANPRTAVASANAPDPRSPTGRTNLLILNGASPDLAPESADIWTAGFDVTSLLSGVSIAATYFHIDYEDKIQVGGAGSNTLVFEDIWSDIITRSPSQAQIDAICNDPLITLSNGCPTNVGAIVDRRLRNLGGLQVRGVDLDVSYETEVGPGSLKFVLGGTRTFTYKLAASPSAPFSSVLDTVGNPLGLRVRGGASWHQGGWGINAFLNYVDDYRDPANNRSVDAWSTVDASISYEFEGSGWLDGTQIQLSSTNILDKEPPFVNQAAGFDFVNATETGRTLGLTVTKAW